MSIPKITGREARNLLDGTTPGPWEARPNGVVVSYATGAQIQLVGHNQRALGDAPLMAAAPALAETIAWLYGAEGQDGHYGKRRWPLGTSWEVALWRGLISIGPEGGGIAFRAPELAEEAARALLAAAEEARP